MYEVFTNKVHLKKSENVLFNGTDIKNCEMNTQWNGYLKWHNFLSVKILAYVIIWVSPIQ